MTGSSLAARDEAVLWHPYSQHGLKHPILPVVSARGAYLELEDGREILDGISSWWVNLHGHSHPRITRAITAQSERMEHILFAGFTHEPGVRLAETLIEAAQAAQAPLTRAFFSDDGSTAVEVALKMAYQYHFNRGAGGRDRFLALRHSYHGDTLGAMAVGEPEGYHAPFRKLLPAVDFVEPGDLNVFLERVDRADCPYAAFIFEPMIQGAGGMRIYGAEFLRQAVEACRRRDVVTIADEVFTGFFRTGKLFAFEHAGIAPDLLCLSKGITGGFLPLAVTLASDRIFEAFYSRDVAQAFLHGHSYTANPIACAAALESWAILQSQECRSAIARIQAMTSERIARLKENPKLKNARFIGTIGAVELNEERSYFNSPPAVLSARALARGVLLRPLGNVIYTVPPYCVTAQELYRIYDVIEEIIHDET